MNTCWAITEVLDWTEKFFKFCLMNEQSFEIVFIYLVSNSSVLAVAAAESWYIKIWQTLNTTRFLSILRPWYIDKSIIIIVVVLNFTHKTTLTFESYKHQCPFVKQETEPVKEVNVLYQRLLHSKTWGSDKWLSSENIAEETAIFVFLPNKHSREHKRSSITFLLNI